MSKMETAINKEIENKIISLRGTQVMLDSDLAKMYQVETKKLNQAVKRNVVRFPEHFRFQLNEKEYDNLKSQFVTSSLSHGGRRTLPYVFTEQGVVMFSFDLNSEYGKEISI